MTGLHCLSLTMVGEVGGGTEASQHTRCLLSPQVLSGELVQLGTLSKIIVGRGDQLVFWREEAFVPWRINHNR